MKCPTCHGNIIEYTNKFLDYCLQCGRYPNKEPVYKIRSAEHKYSGKEYQQINRGKRGTCENCERSEMWLCNKLCGACLTSIKKNRYGESYNCDKNSKEGQKRLKAYRLKRWPERFSEVA